MGSGAGSGGAAAAPLPRGVGAAELLGANRCAEPPFPLVKGAPRLSVEFLPMNSPTCPYDCTPLLY